MGNKTCNDDEIVKYMSNLPRFLQQVEKESSIQEKALNFGVLDWKRLEKWKYNERMPGMYDKKTSSSFSNSSASGPPKMGPNSGRQPSADGASPSSLSSGKQRMPHGSPFSSPQRHRPRGVSPSSLSSGKQPVPHGSRFSSPQRLPPPSLSSHLNSSKDGRNNTYHKEEKFVKGTKSNAEEPRSRVFQDAESITTHLQPDNCHQKVKFYDRSSSTTNLDSTKRKDSEKEIVSAKEASSADWAKHKLSVSSLDGEGRLNDGVDFKSQCCPADQEKIVLLSRKHFPKRSSSESSQFTESRTSLGEQLAEEVRNRISDHLSPRGLHFGESCANIQHSAPFLSAATSRTESAMEAHNSMTSQAMDSGNFTTAHQVLSSFTSIPSEGKGSTVNRGTRRLSFSIEVSDQMQEEIAEQSRVKGGPPSTARPSSFNLERMSTSSTFKERAVTPKFSSSHVTVQSGQVRPEVSSVKDDSEREKENSSSRGRSSPLRRLLDPLLKWKGTQSAQTIQPPNPRLDPMTFRTMGSMGPSRDRKPEASTIQALLEPTLRNGLPFFKLVVDNSSDVLVAVVKKLPTSGKSDPCMIYAFYSVHEIKKKSMNWISQGSKSENCSLGYNIVGQMKISVSYHPKGIAREFVLNKVEPGQVNKEMAAIIVESSSEELNVGDISDMSQLNYERDRQQSVPNVTLDTETHKNSNRMVVILPGAPHSTPIKGTPSSLISRWRSGGSCDCGGWDVGCNLRILTDNRKGSKTLEASDRVDLSVQGGSSKPVFSLEPFSNGLYSIQLDTSISLLEAFATCVAYVTCLKRLDILDTRDQSDTKRSPEANMGTDQMKKAGTFQGQVPAEYVTCPPLSPAGRI
ncbi:hypothetical protein Salat_0994600 [Sesamum alatum]|uniref:Uncharacterized protein n=1 Tax=Sesamum alatum TaxID=300844 RepID=A0AAE1YLA6_9LAMI|nr:hypothetical protein Salat_0994600 [Sesamum alatum]